MGFGMKKIVPIFIALLFIGSILVVFTTGNRESNEARLVVDFGQPGLSFDQQIRVIENSSALRMLSSQVSQVEIENGKIKCIMDYCNTERGEWKVYKVINTPIGFQEEELNQSVEDYIVKKGEIILFRYEYESIKKYDDVLTFFQPGTNETHNITNISLPIDMEKACEIYEQARFGMCGDYTNVSEKEDGVFVIAGLCQPEWEWCENSTEVSWTTIDTNNMTIDSIAIS